MIDNWHKYCQRQMRDNYHTLDETLIFANTLSKESYASKRLPYPLEAGSISAYEELMSTLYSPGEREKIEWAIGAIVDGDSKKIQKFLVLYGPPGSGKSTILNIVQKLFEGYWSVFDSKVLGSSSNAFALEAFKTSPLVAIQHDGDLSRIEDNTRLNSLVSHETMLVNEKFRSQYASQFKCFMFLGTNKPVRITDAKSGLIRRLIDVEPSGEKIPAKSIGTLLAKLTSSLVGSPGTARRSTRKTSTSTTSMFRPGCWEHRMTSTTSCWIPITSSRGRTAYRSSGPGQCTTLTMRRQRYRIRTPGALSVRS